jgi:hypothetical protein
LRWLVLAGDSIVATLAPTDPVIEATKGSLLGADSLGRLHYPRSLAFAPLGNGVLQRPTAHFMLDRATLRADSVTTTRGITLRLTESGSGAQLVFTVPEQSRLFADGWLAIARQDPFRIEWHAPDGRITLGPVLPYPRTRVDAAEKDHWLAGIRRANPGTTFDGAGVPFAEEMPPYASGSLVALPEGTLLLRRHPTSRAPGNDYDIIDRAGNRIATLGLPPSARIVAAGRASVYVATKDDDGIERLSRHPWR